MNSSTTRNSREIDRYSEPLKVTFLQFQRLRILISVCNFWMLESCHRIRFRASKTVKIAVFEAPKRPNLISRKIWGAEKFLDFYTVYFLRFRMEAEILEATTQELMMHDYPSDCCPEGCYLKFPCIAGDPDSPFWQGWGNLRIKTFRLIENKYFEMAVITMILISSLALVSVIFISLPSSC